MRAAGSNACAHAVWVDPIVTVITAVSGSGESDGERSGQSGGQSGGESGGESGGKSGGESGGEKGGERSGQRSGKNGGVKPSIGLPGTGASNRRLHEQAAETVVKAGLLDRLTAPTDSLREGGAAAEAEEKERGEETIDAGEGEDGGAMPSSELGASRGGRSGGTATAGGSGRALRIPRTDQKLSARDSAVAHAFARSKVRA